MEDETKGLQSVAEQVDTSICERTTPQLTPDSCEIDRNDDTDSLSRCIGAGLICDLLYSLTVVTLNSALCHQSYNDRQFSLVRCVWSAGK